MAIQTFVTSQFAVRVSDDDGASYVTVSGLMNINGTIETEEVDNTTFDNDGWTTALAGNKKLTLELEGYRLADPATGARDEGQKMVEKASRTNGTAGLLRYQVYYKPAPTQHITFDGYAMGGNFGGGLNEAEPWNVTIVPSNKPVFTGLIWGEDA